MGRPFFKGIDFDLNAVYDYRPAGEGDRDNKAAFFCPVVLLPDCISGIYDDKGNAFKPEFIISKK